MRTSPDWDHYCHAPYTTTAMLQRKCSTLMLMRVDASLNPPKLSSNICTAILHAQEQSPWASNRAWRSVCHLWMPLCHFMIYYSADLYALTLLSTDSALAKSTRWSWQGRLPHSVPRPGYKLHTIARFGNTHFVSPSANLVSAKPQVKCCDISYCCEIMKRARSRMTNNSLHAGLGLPEHMYDGEDGTWMVAMLKDDFA